MRFGQLGRHATAGKTRATGTKGVREISAHKKTRVERRGRDRGTSGQAQADFVSGILTASTER